jgi:N-acetylglucosamine kinase-like BadF-type ATPase
MIGVRVLPLSGSYSGKFIGIDGGGTKTTCVIGDETGKIQATAAGKSGNIQSKPVDEVKDVVLQLIDDVTAQTETTPDQIQSIYLSMAGCGQPSDKKRVFEALRPFIADPVRLFVETDVVGALAAGTWGEPGIVLIAGTGSIAYTYTSSSEINRVGGWGYLLGDEGSGFDIGRKGLSAVLQQFDGRGEDTMLTGLVMEKLNLANPGELISFVYGRDNVKEGIADLSKLVFTAAKNDDPVAIQIIDEAISELIRLVETNQRVGETKKLPLVISGGLFSDEFFKRRFTIKLRDKLGDLSIIQPAVSPTVGAYMMSLRASGVEITEEVKTITVSSWTRL